MVCDDFTMSAGDVLYMPKGVVHYAITNQEESFHLTIGLHRRNMQWIDVFHHMLLRICHGSDRSGGAASRGAEPRTWRGCAEHDLMELYADTAPGLHLHEAVPGWLLVCLRRWNLAMGAPPSDTPCDQLFEVVLLNLAVTPHLHGAQSIIILPKTRLRLHRLHRLPLRRRCHRRQNLLTFTTSTISIIFHPHPPSP